MAYVASTGRGRIVWCRCGEAAVLTATPRDSLGVMLRRLRADPDGIGREQEERTETRRTFWQRHMGPGHRVVDDDYRALCRPALAGCRNCGAMPTGRLQFYCSAPCRDTFEDDHFWGSARHAAVDRMKVYDVIPTHDSVGRVGHRPAGVICVRCGERCTPEVNHIVPVNGRRPMFGCEHHQSNLEVLCHQCHLDATREQRAAGAFVRPAAQGIVSGIIRPRSDKC